jgi:hypothetical protein
MTLSLTALMAWDAGTDCMKTKSTIICMILILLANNVVLAGVTWIDEHDLGLNAAENSALHADTDSATDDHGDHSNHCCHLQAHYLTIYSVGAEILLRADLTEDSCTSVPNDQVPSFINSPPTPPPKA